MPIYVYRHPRTGEEFEEIRSYSKADTPFIAPDGVKCPRVTFPKSSSGGCVVDKNAEGWEKDPGYYKKLNPKFVRYQDGHRERYNPTKHC